MDSSQRKMMLNKISAVSCKNIIFRKKKKFKLLSAKEMVFAKVDFHK
jgi:hypothetical protein